MFEKISIKFIIITIVSVTFFIAAWYISARVYSFHGNKIEKIGIGNKIVYAEVVSGSKKMQKGLGERDDLCPSCAMLFEFPRLDDYSFWMKGMRFDLDIIWISDKKIMAIEKNISRNFSGVLVPHVLADHVLEMNAGMADKLGIKEGDRISL